MLKTDFHFVISLFNHQTVSSDDIYSKNENEQILNFVVVVVSLSFEPIKCAFPYLNQKIAWAFAVFALNSQSLFFSIAFSYFQFSNLRSKKSIDCYFTLKSTEPNQFSIKKQQNEKKKKNA